LSTTLTFAFTAGALSTVNPCGFAVLPAFLAYYVGHETGAAPSPLAVRVSRGVAVGAALSTGFVAVFTVAGLLLAAGLRLLIGVVPWVAVAVGGGFLILGVLLVGGRTVGLRLNADRLGPQRSDARGMVTFGAAYAVASLSCTLAVLLAVVAQSLATAGLMAMLAVFAAYAAGAASVLVLLAVSAAVASGALARLVRRAIPFAGRVSGAVLMLSGGYLVAYWTPQLTGAGATPLSRGGGVIAGTLTQWLERRAPFVAVLASLVAVAVALSAVRRRNVRAQQTDDCCDAAQLTSAREE
jgi:cytochrome c-type biogenesis protein